MMFYSITLIVTIKYVMVVMRADNEGEGGVMALTALARRLYGADRARPLLLLGILASSCSPGSVSAPAAWARCSAR